MALRDRLTTIRDLAENVLERVEERWDQAMDVLHGRPIRDPYLEDPRQLPQPPGQLPPPPQGVEHTPTSEELALNEEYEQGLWPDIEEEPEPDTIRTISVGEWLVPEAGIETRLNLGQSDEGFHYDVEISHNGGDEGGPHWSKPYPTRELADDAGSLRLHEIHYRELTDMESGQEDDTMNQSRPDGLSELDSKSRELVAAAASAIEKVNWFYDRSPDPAVRSEGFKHMRAAVHSLDAVVTHGDNLRVEYAMDAVDAIKQHTMRTEAASAIWQHHAPKMASETKEYYRPDWFYPERLHAHSWDMGKIAAMGQEYGQPPVSNSIIEVRARDWWEDQRAMILETQAEHDDPFGRRSESIQQQIEALGPEPSNDAKVWLNDHGQRVEQPSVELQPIEIERPAIEERADRDAHALGLEREEERSHEAAELEL